MVSGLKARVEAMETGSIAERFEVLWQRVLKLEESLERATTERRETSALETASEHRDNRLWPRLTSLEARVDEQHAAIQLLQAQASQMEATLQAMITAVARLTNQILRAFPGLLLLRRGSSSPLPWRSMHAVQSATVTCTGVCACSNGAPPLNCSLRAMLSPALPTPPKTGTA